METTTNAAQNAIPALDPAIVAEMLDALEECYAFIRGLRMTHLVGDYCIDADYRLRKAAKAIAKAKGEA